MNAVVTNSPANHVDDVARNGCFDVGRASIGKCPWHNADGSTINQRFSDVPVIEHNCAVDRRYPRFIPTYADTGMNTT